ncbi:hypothetical protein pb186bvf_012149 [Paramecium bursaria]
MRQLLRKQGFSSAFEKLEADAVNQQKSFKVAYLTFQREWKQFTNEIAQEPERVLNDKLSPAQKKRLDLIFNHYKNLTELESRYLMEVLRKKAVSKIDQEHWNSAITEEDLAEINDGLWPVAHPRWLLQQEAMSKLWPLGQKGIATLFSEIVGFGSGGAPSGDAGKSEAKTEEKVEEVKKQEKLSWDLELGGFDAAKKISIIKEVRAIFNLGLKDAKDLVEKAPTILQKALKKEDAETLKTKLEGFGCTINLI